MRNAIVAVAACATLLWVGAALAVATPAQNCDSARITAWKVYQSCVDTVVAKEAKGVMFDSFKAFWKCRRAYFKKWTGFQGKASLAGSSCIGARLTDNGSLTVTDNLTGLVWEKKTAKNGSPDWSNPRDPDNTYTWGTGSSPYYGNGTAFATFLTGAGTGLNVVGFAGARDWRLPTLAELQTILLDFTCTGYGNSYPTCVCTGPCIDPVLGNLQADFYWSATTVASSPGEGWGVLFDYGGVRTHVKPGYFYVRAVRGGW